MNKRNYTGFIVRFCITALLGTGLPTAASTGAKAQEIGDTVEGHKLAETWCRSCHVIDIAQQQGVSNGAPTFPAIAHMKSTTMLSLHAFLLTPHNRMPDLHLSRDDIDNISAYILSLRRN